MRGLDDQKGIADFLFSSEGPGRWCLVKHGGDAPWIHLTLSAKEDDVVVRTISTNDAEIVKQVLNQPGEGLRVRSFQAVFPCSFPDNQGVGVADIYELREGKTKKGVIFHSFSTNFGIWRIGGPHKLMASEILHGSEVVLYTADRPRERYFGR